MSWRLILVSDRDREIISEVLDNVSHYDEELKDLYIPYLYPSCLKVYNPSKDLYTQIVMPVEHNVRVGD